MQQLRHALWMPVDNADSDCESLDLETLNFKPCTDQAGQKAPVRLSQRKPMLTFQEPKEKKASSGSLMTRSQSNENLVPWFSLTLADEP